ncbi:hypothetical protein [Xanthomonas axonopodis]|nr:hypothetical protein [Xanthomonas axonopodis]
MIALSGCDTDFFKSDCRAIGDSNYSLCRNQDGHTVFYLEPAHQSPSGGGVLDGTVKSIGWNDKVIVASRQSTFRGDPDGLMVIDIASKKIDGPLDKDAVKTSYPSIKLSEASDVWKALR